MPKPTPGQHNWGDQLNAFLDEKQDKATRDADNAADINNSASAISATIATFGVRPFPSGILGGNLVPRPGGDWRELAATWDWDNWIKPQIDRASILGLNLVRLILAPGVTLPKVSTGGGSSATITSATYDARLRQIATYAAQRGLYFYPCLVTDVDFVDVNASFNYALYVPGDPGTLQGTNFQHAGITSAVAHVAEVLAKYPNVVGFDVFQESPTGVTEADILAIMAAVRAVAPRVPMTSSISTGNWENTAQPSAKVVLNHAQGVGSDFDDRHTYATTEKATAPDYAISLHGKPFLIGEFGGALSAGQTAQQNAFKNAARLANRQGCLGAIVWALADQGTTDALKFGVWDNTGFVPGTAPLSTTAGKRTYLTDLLRTEFRKTPTPAPRYSPPELLTEVQIRPSLYNYGWADGGNATPGSHPLGLKITCNAASAVVVTGNKFPVEAGKAYRLRLESMRGTGAARAVYVYLTLHTSDGTYVDAVGTGINQNADPAIPNVHEVVWHFNAATWPTVTQVAVRVNVTGATVGETHYILDGATLKATT